VVTVAGQVSSNKHAIARSARYVRLSKAATAKEISLAKCTHDGDGSVGTGNVRAFCWVLWFDKMQ
jgi:hypothetical protein